MSRLSQFLDSKLPRTLRTSVILLASIIAVWVVWLLLMLIDLMFTVFVAVGNGDRPMSDSAFPNTSLRYVVEEIINGVPIIYMLVGILLVCVMNLLYLCRYWDLLPVKKKVLSGVLFSVTSLPFLFIVFALLMRFMHPA